MTIPPPVQLPKPPDPAQHTTGRFSHFHHGVRWFYRIAFGFIGLGILESIVESFILALGANGTINLPRFGQLYLVQIALRSPLLFWSASAILIGLGTFGFIIDRRFTKAKKAHDEENIKDVAHEAGTIAGGQVIEQKAPEIFKMGIVAANEIHTAVEREVEKVLKGQDRVFSVLRTETPLWKLPKDIAVLPLPPAASGLIGREKDQVWLQTCIFDSKIVGVSGLGGVGKTALVADTIKKASSQFRSGGVAVILANEVLDAIDILRQLIEKFVPNQQELLSRPGIRPNILRDALSDTLAMYHENANQVLIVIDNVEQGLVTSEGFKQLCDIFRSTEVSVVMTAREPFSARLVNDSRELEVFTNEAAVDLLTRLLKRSPGGSLSDSERQDAAEICEIAGNHAQAIVLIDAYLEDHPHESLASYLRQLKVSPKIVLDLVDRLQPIEASRGIRITFASSYTQLEEPAQRLFVALGALTGKGCTYRAVQALGAVLKQSKDEMQVSLDSLIRSKLVLKPSTDSLTPIERVHLHPLVQEFARELLRSSSDFLEDTFYEALASHYVEWVQKTSEELLDADDANIMAALKWAKVHPSREVKVIQAKLIYNLRWYWYSRFRFEEAFEWLKVGCAAMEYLGVDYDELRGELLFAMGIQYQRKGEMSNAEFCYKKSFEIFDEIGKKGNIKAGLGEALSGLAALAQQGGETEEAQRHYERSLAIFRDVHDQHSEAYALYRLGFLALRTGDTDAAERYYTDSLNILLKLEDVQWGKGIIMYSLGDVFQQVGEVGKTRKHYEDGLAICREIHDRRGEAVVLKAIGDLALQTSGPTEAGDYLSRSLAIFREIFDPQGESVALYSIAFLLRQIGRIDTARDLYNKSLEIREKVKDERGRGFVLKGLGDLTRRVGDMNTAKDQLEEGLATSRKVKDRRNEGVALKALGDWAWQAGDMVAAQGNYNKSLPIRKDFHDLRGEAITLKALGDLALEEGDRITAQNHLKRSSDLFLQVKDLRGQGVTLHSFGVLALEQSDKTTAQKHLDQSLNLLRRVQDRQSEGTVLYTLAVWAEMQGDLVQAEKWHRESLQIATEVKAANSIAISQEVLGNFLIRHYGQGGREEGEQLLIEASKAYKHLGVARDDDTEHVEERGASRYKGDDRDKIVRALIYDLDEGPNGQGFALSNERRNTRRPV